MNRTGLVLVLVVATAASCQQDDDIASATTFAEDALSLAPPPGWDVTRQKDVLVFVGSSAGDEGRPTIAIRSVDVSGWSEPRTADNVLPSVETVLRALPAAEVRGPVEIDHPAYRAVAYDVVFTPRSRRGKKYERRHVVVLAGDRVFHAFLTAPQGQLATNRSAFDRVLASLREET